MHFCYCSPRKLQPALTYASESFNNVKQWMSEVDGYARCSLHRRRSKKSGKNESVEFTECEQQLPRCCGWCRWHLHAEFLARSSPSLVVELRKVGVKRGGRVKLILYYRAEAAGRGSVPPIKACQHTNVNTLLPPRRQQPPPISCCVRHTCV